MLQRTGYVEEYLPLLKGLDYNKGQTSLNNDPGVNVNNSVGIFPLPPVN